MPKDNNQPVAFSFQDYRDEAIIDFFANENRSFQPDISSSLSVSRLRLVGSSRLEQRPTAAFRSSIRLTEGIKKISTNVTAKSTNDCSKKSKSVHKTLSSKTPKQEPQSKPDAQLKTTETIQAVTLIKDCNDNNFNSVSGEVDKSIEAALSKPVRPLASLSRSCNVNDKLSSDKTSEPNFRISKIKKSGKEIKGGSLNLPSIVTPVLKPVLPLHDRINALKKKATEGADALKLVTLQVSDMRREIDNAVKNKKIENNNEIDNNNENKIELKIVKENSSDTPELRVIDIDNQTELEQNSDSELNNNNNNDEYEDEHNEHNEHEGYNNIQSSIKLDQNLQKLVKSWSRLPEQVKETIISAVENSG
ncbi:MAG: hypothetical protein LBE18_09115 [Planctomycetaceae bacterium]|jgi:hypothetical protein|nr:hypothetical protein [Planctomycetaceae bacterium]